MCGLWSALFGHSSGNWAPKFTIQNSNVRPFAKPPICNREFWCPNARLGCPTVDQSPWLTAAVGVLHRECSCKPGLTGCGRAPRPRTPPAPNRRRSGRPCRRDPNTCQLTVAAGVLHRALQLEAAAHLQRQSVSAIRRAEIGSCSATETRVSLQLQQGLYTGIAAVSLQL